MVKLFKCSIIQCTNLSPVGEDDAEGHNAEDEEARGAGGDD